jgi:ribosomal protein S27E
MALPDQGSGAALSVSSTNRKCEEILSGPLPRVPPFAPLEIEAHMALTLTCRDCGHVNQVDMSRAGQKFLCNGCGKMETLPASQGTAGESDEPTLLRFVCPACGKKYATQPKLAGQKIRCKGCGAGVRVPESASGDELRSCPHLQPRRGDRQEPGSCSDGRPSGAANTQTYRILSRGLRPWLLTVAPPGLPKELAHRTYFLSFSFSRSAASARTASGFSLKRSRQPEQQTW